MQRHLFIMDPIEKLNLDLDTSLKLARKLGSMGDQVFFCEPRHIHWHSSAGAAMVHARRFDFSGNQSVQLSHASVRYALPDFHGVHMRKDPPFDMNYIGTTWLLDSATQSARVMNDPQALRDHNEKLAIFQFPSDTLSALVSSDTQDLLQFALEDAHGDAIIKPLDMFGGQGVSRLQVIKDDEPSMAEARRTLDHATNQGTVMRLIQPFDKRIYEGEVRAFAVGGIPLAWCLKLPASGSFLANTRAGAQLSPYTPSSGEIETVERVSKALLDRGIFVVGYDLIGGKISEINVTSPRLLQGRGDLTDYFLSYADLVRTHCERS